MSYEALPMNAGVPTSIPGGKDSMNLGAGFRVEKFTKLRPSSTCQFGNRLPSLGIEGRVQLGNKGGEGPVPGYCSSCVEGATRSSRGAAGFCDPPELSHSSAWGTWVWLAVPACAARSRFSGAV